VTRVYRDAGTPLCTLSFLFGLRQEESLKVSLGLCLSRGLTPTLTLSLSLSLSLGLILT
jgi:hypothetical protein